MFAVAAARVRPMLVPALAGAAALAIAAVVIRPTAAALIGSDTASSVLYFERIAAGEPLERFLGTTPKPLLTAIAGGLLAVTGDWRAIAWLALVVYAAAIAVTTALASRTAGIGAGAFVGTALIASSGLLLDASLAYAVSWALLAASVAGLALTATPPRYGLAGIAIGLGALARQEVAALGGAALLVLAVCWVLRPADRVTLRPAWRLSAWLLALPINVAHDLLLARDPVYTLRVPALGAEGRDSGGIEAAVRALAAHGLGNPLLVLLAVVGVAVLVRRRAWSVLLGALAIAGGVGCLVLGVGLRQLVVLDRYALPVELALILLAGSAFGAVAAFAGSQRGERIGHVAQLVPPRARPAATAALGVAVALALTPHIGPLDQATTEVIRREARAARDYAAILPALAAEVGARPGLRTPPTFRDAHSLELEQPALYVTPRLLPIVLVDLDLRLDHVARLTELDLSLAPEPGTLVLHLRRLERRPDPAWADGDAAGAHPLVAFTELASVRDRAFVVGVGPRR